MMSLVVILMLLAIELLPRVAHGRRFRSCQANLKEIGQAMTMYTAESRGEMFPPVKTKDCDGAVQPFSGAMDFAAVFPEYLSEPNLFVCPSFEHGKTALEIWDEGKTGNPRWKRVEGFTGNGAVDPCEVLGSPYYYYGWALSDLTFGPWDRSEDAEPEDYVPEDPAIKGGVGRSVRVTEQYTPHIHNMRFRLATVTFSEKLASGRADISEQWRMEYPSGKPIHLPFGSSFLFMREGAERYLCRDIGNPSEPSRVQAQIVVLHEDLKHPRAFLPSALAHANVLYMDGHVEGMAWLKGSKFPYNEAGEILREAVAGTLKMPEGYEVQADSAEGK
jgi:prepilin-type processing-associated H-X9-DG protein